MRRDDSLFHWKRSWSKVQGHFEVDSSLLRFKRGSSRDGQTTCKARMSLERQRWVWSNTYILRCLRRSTRISEGNHQAWSRCKYSRHAWTDLLILRCQAWMNLASWVPLRSRGWSKSCWQKRNDCCSNGLKVKENWRRWSFSLKRSSRPKKETKTKRENCNERFEQRRKERAKEVCFD